MAVNDIYHYTGYYTKANAYGLGAVKRITKRFSQIVTLSGVILENIANIFVERARKKLIDSGYANMEHYANNIVVTKYKNNNYRVGIRENREKPIMYFLEFGTGLVGKESVGDFSSSVYDSLSEIAKKVGWQYAVNENEYIYSREFKDNGWYYWDEKKGRFSFTSGLYPVAYLYQTMNEMPQIIEEAKRRVGFNGK